jgi:hypothetical protein
MHQINKPSLTSETACLTRFSIGTVSSVRTSSIAAIFVVM